MPLDGGSADEERLGDLPVGVSRSHEAQHFQFARRQPGFGAERLGIAGISASADTTASASSIAWLGVSRNPSSRLRELLFAELAPEDTRAFVKGVDKWGE